MSSNKPRVNVRDLSEVERSRLRELGLVNEANLQVGPRECPGVSWDHDGYEFAMCQRPRGHGGHHMFIQLWDDDEGSSN